MTKHKQTLKGVIMNNFDQSSTGLNITVSAFRDTNLSRTYFEDAFFIIKEGIKESLVYCEGNFSDFEKDYSFTKAELLAAYADYMGDNCSRSDFLNDFKSNMGFGYSKATKQDLIDFIKADLYEEYEWNNFCEKAGFKSNFDIVVSTGYCQGDYREIIVPHKFWECIGVKKPESVQANLGDYIDNLLWDCPIYCRFEVNGEEFYIDQELGNNYFWDKAEALEIAKKLVSDAHRIEQYLYVFNTHEKEEILNFLTVALKTDLDYQ